MKRVTPLLSFSAVVLTIGVPIVLLGAAHPPRTGGEIPLEISRIYWEYNSSANDLGVHVILDGEDWYRLKITNPADRTIFSVQGQGPYRELGMTELFFEGAEPSLEDVPLEELLAKFPAGEYEFEGRTVDGEAIEGTGAFSHAIPAGPAVFANLGPDDLLRIEWDAVTGAPADFPVQRVDVVAYQVLVESFQVTVPASVLGVTVPPEFVGTLAPGLHQFEVLAIEASGNQSITEGFFFI